MTFLNITTLQGWVDDFAQLGYAYAGDVRVIPQDGEEGNDTGLVAVSLRSVSTKVYIQPVEVGSLEWCVSFEPRLETAAISAAKVTNMAAELTTVAALCTFLEGNARRHFSPDAP
ncbi:hypothetical protein ACIQLJ_14210 [Microbacterium sp. NPDC091313]